MVHAPFAEASALYAKSQPAAALALLDGCEATPATDTLRGRCLLAMRRFQEALDRFQGVLDAVPAEALALLGALGAASALGRWNEALTFAERLLAARPDHAAARHYKAKALSQLGRREEAVAELRLLDQDDLRNGASLLLLSRLLLETPGGSGEAEAVARQVLEHEPNSVNAHQIVGECLLRAENFAEGWDEYFWRQQGPVHAKHKRPFTIRQWQGEPLAGKLLVLPDNYQGLGIEGLCAGFYRELLERGLSLVHLGGSLNAFIVSGAFRRRSI